jgi:hypothetical protein
LERIENPAAENFRTTVVQLRVRDSVE